MRPTREERRSLDFILTTLITLTDFIDDTPGLMAKKGDPLAWTVATYRVQELMEASLIMLVTQFGCHLPKRHTQPWAAKKTIGPPANLPISSQAASQ